MDLACSSPAKATTRTEARIKTVKAIDLIDWLADYLIHRFNQFNIPQEDIPNLDQLLQDYQGASFRSDKGAESIYALAKDKADRNMKAEFNSPEAIKTKYDEANKGASKADIAANTTKMSAEGAERCGVILSWAIHNLGNEREVTLVKT